MELRAKKGTGILKSLILTGLCGLLIVLAIQTDLPTYREMLDSVQSKFMDYKFESSALSLEELLREGWLHYNLGQYEKARQFMERAAEGETNISALYCLGLVDMKYRQFENAINKFRIVAARSPKHTATRMALGEAYFELQYWGQAAYEFEQAVKLETTNEAARLWLGKSYMNLKQDEKAKGILVTVTHGRESAEAAALLKSINEQKGI